VKHFILTLAALAAFGCSRLEEREMAMGLIEPSTDPDPAHVELLQRTAIETTIPGGQRPYPEGINIDHAGLAELLAQAEAALDAGKFAAAAQALAKARSHVSAIAAVDNRLLQEVRQSRTAKGSP